MCRVDTKNQYHFIKYDIKNKLGQENIDMNLEVFQNANSNSKNRCCPSDTSIRHRITRYYFQTLRR